MQIAVSNGIATLAIGFNFSTFLYTYIAKGF